MCSRVPSATQLLAWLGADVIKLEAPGTGDVTRSQLRDIPGADSLYFTMLNCNKRSITLNMKSDEGKQIFTDLVSRVDILVENFGPGVVDRFGFTWERLREINPRLDLCLHQGIRSRQVLRLQSLRSHRAGDGRLDGHHRFRGRAARGNRCSDR